MTKPAVLPSRLHLHDFDIRDGALIVGVVAIIGRSEEHTSELQSPC